MIIDKAFCILFLYFFIIIRIEGHIASYGRQVCILHESKKKIKKHLIYKYLSQCRSNASK